LRGSEIPPKKTAIVGLLNTGGNALRLSMALALRAAFAVVIGVPADR